MSKSSLLKRSLFSAVAFIIFSGARADIYGQAGLYYFGKQILFDYKWSILQKWDDYAKDWKDTLAVTYTISGADGKPSEVITLDYANSYYDVLREVITYNGAKIANITAYIMDSLGGEYEKVPSHTRTYWYSGDIMVKNEVVYKAGENDNFSIKLHVQTRFKLDNQRTTADSMFRKMSGTTEELLFHGYSPEDTVWYLSDRSEYSYKGNSIVKLNYYDSTDSPISKDSTVMTGDKITEIYDFGVQFDGEWILNDAITITYDGDRVDQIIYQDAKYDSLVNKFRVQFFHTPYPFTGTKHICSSHRTSRINAFVSEGNGSYVVILFLNQSSDISIYLTDLRGRKLGNSVRQRVSPGSFSLPLSVSSPGKYLCHITSGQDRTVVPFTKIK